MSTNKNENKSTFSERGSPHYDNAAEMATARQPTKPRKECQSSAKYKRNWHNSYLIFFDIFQTCQPKMHEPFFFETFEPLI